jgi:glycosyltransferase involved in cell wall biosynthesis
MAHHLDQDHINVLRILHLIPGLANASGPTHVVTRYAERFATRGHEVSVFHVSGRGKDAVQLPEGIEDRSFPATYAKGWAYSPALATAMEDELCRFDIVHVHSLWCYPNLVMRRLARRKHVPYVIRPAGSLEPWSMTVSSWQKKIYFQAIEKSNLQHAAAIHAMSEKEADHLGAYGLRPPVWTIPNGMDAVSSLEEESLQRLRASMGVDTDGTLLVFLGRLHPVKNLPFLLEVFQAAQRKHPSMHLAIAGPDQDPYAGTLKKRVADEGLGKQVTFLGEVQGEQKSRLLQAADLLCLPSLSENFGNAVLEALASGAGVFASNTTPWSELDGWGVGRCLPLDLDTWVTALDEAEDRKAWADWGIQARRVAAEQFSWDVVADRLAAAYEQVIT